MRKVFLSIFSATLLLVTGVTISQAAEVQPEENMFVQSATATDQLQNFGERWYYKRKVPFSKYPPYTYAGLRLVHVERSSTNLYWGYYN